MVYDSKIGRNLVCMKMVSHAANWLLIVVFSFGLTSSSAFGGESGKLDEKQVEFLLKSIEAGWDNLDSKVLTDHLAKDAVIKIQLENSKGGRKLNFKAGEYKSYLEQGVNAVSDYEARHRDRTIKVAKDGKSAEVSELLWEAMTVSDRRTTARSKQTMVLALENGKLLIKKIDMQVLAVQ